MKGMLWVCTGFACFYVGAAFFLDYRYDLMAEAYCREQGSQIALDCRKDMNDTKPNMLLGPLQTLVGFD